MEFKDYYEILGVKRDASQADLKKAYRKLARKFHPDISKAEDAEAKFKEVNEAFEVLKDPEKRVAYDQLGANWQAGHDFQPPPDWDAGFEFSGGGYTRDDAEGFSDFFKDLFGHTGGASRGPRTRPTFHARGEDHHAKVMIDIADTYHGAERALSLRAPELGEDGHVRLREHTLNVKIPKGVKEGQHIRLKGQGGPGLGEGKAGDLLLEIHFSPDPLYQAKGRDIYLDLPVAPWEAALGATIKAPTPMGPVDLKIPANSASGRKLRLKGRGIPGKPPGDLYAVLKIMLPPADSDKAKQLYKDMAQQMNFDPRARLGV